MDAPKILFAGDRAVTVQFGTVIDLEVYARVKALNDQLKALALPGIVETIPTFRSLMVHYDPLVLPYEELETVLYKAIEQGGSAQNSAKKVIYIPTCFGGEYGEDLQSVADYHNTTPEKIVELTCSSDFLIYMLGFSPGYCYVGGVPDDLATPRLDSPRLKVPAGSVAVGGQQLGIYPVPSPGGFRLLGRTPVKTYDPTAEKPVLLEAGEYIRFVSITPEEYAEIEKQVAEGTYTCKIVEG